MRTILLLPFTLIFHIVVFIWDAYWKIRKPEKIDARVISVGNISVGGSGKTSLVDYVARSLISRNQRVGVVARGYGRPKPGSEVICVGPESLWSECGDEPLALARSTPGLRVYVDRSKTAAAIRASQDGCDYIIIDDGFQHRRLMRDFDIVCFEGDNRPGSRLLLPSGRLREPFRSLRRADAIVIFDDPDRLIEWRKWVPENIPIFTATKTVAGIRSSRGENIDIRGKKVLGFCGLANPDSFYQSLINSGCSAVDFLKFRDHHIYGSDDIRRITELCESRGANHIITTLKDFVKFENIWPEAPTIYYLEIRIELDREDQFNELLNG